VEFAILLYMAATAQQVTSSRAVDKKLKIFIFKKLKLYKKSIFIKIIIVLKYSFLNIIRLGV
jgi:hypothetical protein